VLDAGQLGQQLRDFPGPVVRLAVVAVAVHGEQHLGFDLAQAVQHDGRPHVGRAAGQTAPMLAQARNAITVSGRLGM